MNELEITRLNEERDKLKEQLSLETQKREALKTLLEINEKKTKKLKKKNKKLKKEINRLNEIIKRGY